MYSTAIYIASILAAFIPAFLVSRAMFWILRRTIFGHEKIMYANALSLVFLIIATALAFQDVSEGFIGILFLVYLLPQIVWLFLDSTRYTSGKLPRYTN